MSKPQKCNVWFEMNGKQYSFTMVAESWDDAEARMRAIRMTGRVVGFPCYEVKMPGPLGYLLLPLMPLITGFLNLIGWKPRA